MRFTFCGSSNREFYSNRIQQWTKNRKHFVNARNAHNIETLLHLLVVVREAVRLIKLAAKLYVMKYQE